MTDPEDIPCKCLSCMISARIDTHAEAHYAATGDLLDAMAAVAALMNVAAELIAGIDDAKERRLTAREFAKILPAIVTEARREGRYPGCAEPQEAINPTHEANGHVH